MWNEPSRRYGTGRFTHQGDRRPWYCCRSSMARAWLGWPSTISSGGMARQEPSLQASSPSGMN
eukprot:7761316-Lingulodinium_polyedra.AAC.1